MPNKKRDFAVIGLGTFGLTLARELTRLGDRVLGIDSDPKQVGLMSDELHATLEADATDVKALNQCGLKDYDAIIVSIGENIQASIIAAMNVLELGIERLWVKAQDETHRKILSAIGVPNIVLPEQSYGLQLAQSIHNPYLTSHLTLQNGHYVTEIRMTERMFGRRIEDVGLLDKHNLTCLGVVSRGKLIVDKIDKHALETDDRLLVYGKRLDLRQFADAM